MAKRKTKDLSFSPQCFTLKLEVFPQVAMAKENALKLATNLAMHQELTDIHMGDEAWVFRRPQAKGHSRGHVEVKVEDQEITIEHQFPNAGLERFEMLVEKTVDSVGDAIKTQMVFGVVVTLEYIVDIGGDVRKAILGSMEMLGDDDDESEGDQGKLAVFQRPCHFVGLRLGFPSYRYVPTEEEEKEKGGANDPPKEEKKENDKEDESPPEGENWQATITLQSLLDDPGGLSVEVSGRWMGPITWEKSKEFVSACLGKVDDFLKTKTKAFLLQFGSEE